MLIVQNIYAEIISWKQTTVSFDGTLPIKIQGNKQQYNQYNLLTNPFFKLLECSVKSVRCFNVDRIHQNSLK